MGSSTLGTKQAAAVGTVDQSTSRNHGCALTSAAPLWPRRFLGSFMSRLSTKSTASGDGATSSSSGHCTWSKTACLKTAWGESEMKGGSAVRNSNRQIPSAHQSASYPWALPRRISGARYSGVPTHDSRRTLWGETSGLLSWDSLLSWDGGVLRSGENGGVCNGGEGRGGEGEMNWSGEMEVGGDCCGWRGRVPGVTAGGEA
mmetsp:Transcript_15120/g.35878  ORF Transcript_15120/g.35878 Transcript_15120/m.35878 type:complete len:202 (-) Transcript_15120:875-1480(-)